MATKHAKFSHLVPLFRKPCLFRRQNSPPVCAVTPGRAAKWRISLGEPGGNGESHKVASAVGRFKLEDIVDNALKFNDAGLHRHGATLKRDEET